MSQKDTNDATSSKAKAGHEGGLKHTALGQQRMSAWQPVLAPRWMTVALAIIGIGFIALGIVLIQTSNGVVECVINYGDPEPDCLIEGGCLQNLNFLPSDCRGSNLRVDNAGQISIAAPVYLYYSLTKFYQNHRRYMLSRSASQLQGNIIIETSRLADCEPALMSDDGYRILTPCGLAARSVFNDTFRLRRTTGTFYDLHESVDDIVWPLSMRTRFRNPSGEDNPALQKLDQWLDEEIFPGRMENAHFMVWMRNAALPNFRKLYARIDQDVVLPVVVDVMNRYPLNYFGGRKFLVLSTTSWLGGKNPFLGVIFVTLGALFFIVGLCMAVRNRRDPRILGDVRFLKWTKGKQS